MPRRTLLVLALAAVAACGQTSTEPAPPAGRAASDVLEGETPPPPPPPDTTGRGGGSMGSGT